MEGATIARYLRRAAFIGVIGGIVAIYLAAIGMVERFEARSVITGVIGLGTTIHVILVFLIGYRAGTPVRQDVDLQSPPAWLRLAAALVAGLLTGLVLGGLVVLAEAINLRPVFLNVSPRLIELLSFGQPPALAPFILAGGGAAIALVAAGIGLLPPTLRKSVLAGLIGIILMSMLEPLARPMFSQLGLRQLTSVIYERVGLTLPATVAIFVVVAAVSGAWLSKGNEVRTTVRRLDTKRTRSLQFVAFGLLAVALLIAPQILGTFISEILSTVGLFVLLAIGLNIVVGYAGLLDLGYVAFYAVGAYATALLTASTSVLQTNIPFLAAIPLVMVVAAITGLAIGAPVLRLRGDYLAIVTLGFGEIARILFLSDALRPWFGGAQGIIGVPPIQIGGAALIGPQEIYYPILIACVFAAFVAWRLANSRVGRAWNAMREDEAVAEATGINTVNYKLLAFAMGAAIGCLSGALFSAKVGSVFPGSFDILVSITVLAAIILGGIGSIPGVIVGAFVLFGLPNLLREFAEYRLLVYGAVLVAMMLLRPEGLLPSRIRRRELHEHESDEEQYGERTGVDVGAPVVS